jgi:lactate dehydrogenase-like 2-hydroxyacid dehydrogenase
MGAQNDNNCELLGYLSHSVQIADRRVLLIGVGGIGQEIAKRLAPFEVELTRGAAVPARTSTVRFMLPPTSLRWRHRTTSWWR